MNRRGLHSVSVIVALLTAVSCGGSGKNTTTGHRVTLHTRIVSEPGVASPFTSGVKWNVTLSKAAVSVGSLYYFDGAPAFVRLSPPKPNPFDRLERLFIGTAWAHPGHYIPGNAMGNMLEPSSSDLFTSATLADGTGVSGTFRSARFVLGDRPVGAAEQELEGHVASAEGVATKDDLTVYFRVSADFADVAKSVKNGEVEGCEFVETDVETDGTVTVTVKPSVWFNLVDFTNVAPGTANAPTTIPPGDIAQIGFALGVVQLSAYHFTYEKVSP